MSDLIVRCSSIGKLMAKPENADIDPQFMTEELRGIIAKTKRSDDEKALLEAARDKSLSAGGKTHVRALVREAIYGFQPTEVQTRYTDKGKQVEGECIALLSRLLGRPLVKNTERRTNGVISGECDVWDAPIGRDIKAPWSWETMPIVVADAADSDYEWQMRGYMLLWDAQQWSVDYVLVSTPPDLIPPFESEATHYVDYIPEHLRWTAWVVRRDPALEARIADKVAAARRYYRQVLNEFDRTHQQHGAAAAAAVIANPPWGEAPAAPATTPATPEPTF